MFLLFFCSLKIKPHRGFWGAYVPLNRNSSSGMDERHSKRGEETVVKSRFSASGCFFHLTLLHLATKKCHSLTIKEKPRKRKAPEYGLQLTDTQESFVFSEIRK